MFKRVMQILGGLGVALLVSTAAGQSEKVSDDFAQEIKEATVLQEFVIVRSVANYDDARKTAAEAARRLRVPLKLRHLAPTPQGGLSFPKAECEENGWDYPCYVARGRYDDGSYVSIEYSSAYSEFKPKLFIVVVASGSKGSASLKRAEQAAKRVFPDAYRRTAGVYMGCMH